MLFYISLHKHEKKNEQHVVTRAAPWSPGNRTPVRDSGANSQVVHIVYLYILSRSVRGPRLDSVRTNSAAVCSCVADGVPVGLLTELPSSLAAPVEPQALWRGGSGRKRRILHLLHLHRAPGAHVQPPELTLPEKREQWTLAGLVGLRGALSISAPGWQTRVPLPVPI